MSNGELRIVCHYDTTFGVAGFHVSILLVRDYRFVGNPCVPVALIVHQERPQVVHEQLFDNLISKIPFLDVKDVVLVTDREQAILNAAQKYNFTLLACWVHILQNVERFIRYEVKGSESDVQ